MAYPTWYRPQNPGWGAAATRAKNQKKRKRTSSAAPRQPTQSAEDWAREQAQKYIDAQVQAIEEQRRIYLQELQRQAAIAAERGQALAAYLQKQDFAGSIGNIYKGAASDIAGFAEGFAGSTRDIASAQAAEQMNLVSGTGQEGAVRNEGVGMGDVLYGVGGFFPAQGLERAGAAFAADAALQPGFAARQGQFDAQAIQAEGLNSSIFNQFSADIAKVKSGQQDLEMEYLEYKNELRDQERASRLDEREFALKKLESERDYLLELARQAREDGKLALSQKYYKLAQRKEKAKQAGLNGMNPDGTPRPGFHVDPTGIIVKDGTRINPKTGLPEPDPKWNKKDKGPKQTPAQKKAEKIEKELEKVATNTSNAVSRVTELFYDKDGAAKPIYLDKTYQQLYNILFSQFGGPLLTTQKARNKLRDIIKRVLLQLGVRPGRVVLRRGGQVVGGLPPRSTAAPPPEEEEDTGFSGGGTGGEVK